jgi:hypothetical protein
MLLWVFNISKSVLISKFIVWLFSKTCLEEVFFTFHFGNVFLYIILKFLFVLLIQNVLQLI